jgi:hypothetical protein
MSDLIVGLYEVATRYDIAATTWHSSSLRHYGCGCGLNKSTT